jgi:hypothetical protein
MAENMYFDEIEDIVVTLYPLLSSPGRSMVIKSS